MPAISDLREALNDQPRSPELMQLLATAYERSGAIDLAEKQFADAMKASNYDPNDWPQLRRILTPPRQWRNGPKTC